jgi:hypothetical protein
MKISFENHDPSLPPEIYQNHLSALRLGLGR